MSNLRSFASLAAAGMALAITTAAFAEDGVSHTGFTAVSVESLTTPRSERAEIAYRWWATQGRSDFGVGLGAQTSGPRSGGGAVGTASEAALASPLTIPVLMLGVRYRSSERATLLADASSAIKRLAAEEESAPGGGQAAGVLPGFRLQAPRLNLVQGGVGLQLADDTRMMLRMRKGGLGISMRRSF